MKPLRTDVAEAFSLLTRLPVGWLWPRDAVPSAARAVWAYPLVGLVIGGLAGAANTALHWLGVPSSLSAVWTVAVLLLITGALHEDGLADTADGFGGGRTRARKLEIMRDSRIGTYGAVALVVSLGARAAAIFALHGHATAALMATCALARSGSLLVVESNAPARSDGLGAGLAPGSAASALVAAALALAAGFILLPLATAILATLLTASAGWGMACFARRQIGGYTGDVLGATIAGIECLVLTVCVLR